MNTLSWVFYLAGAVEPVKAFIGIFAFLLITGGIVFLILCREHVASEIFNSKNDIVKGVRKKAWLMLLSGLLCAITAILLPSKDTVYLMAFSEYGEAALKSPEGQEILEVVRALIKEQLK